ncbi:MAG TPA: SH3 domain-containing protein [Patescibacteria group bacterium]|nr:SH3 domain-containing protein [Patescibacteria group bacterium]
MPANGIKRTNEEGSYNHVFNIGVEKRVIFSDQEDYETFLGYLKDYLTSTEDQQIVKKSFTIKGRVFSGKSHQPKNYFGKVELTSYSLTPNHFHLLLRQVAHGSVERFMRSLTTRYSIYFNKKYKRTGALFQGPYKSIEIKDGSLLLLLTRMFHIHSNNSSYNEYLGTRSTSWVKPISVTSSYKDFVENHKLDQKEKELLNKVAFEDESEYAKLPDPVVVGADTPEIDDLEEPLEPILKTSQFITLAVIIFLLLVSLGVKHILASENKTPQSIVSPAPQTDSVKPNVMLSIKTTPSGKVVNIRSKSNVDSVVVGKANDGDRFELVSMNMDWYEVKLTDGSTGFISAEYVEMEDKQQ